MDYKQKYLKYKRKYLTMKKGGEILVQNKQFYKVSCSTDINKQTNFNIYELSKLAPKLIKNNNKNINLYKYKNEYYLITADYNSEANKKWLGLSKLCKNDDNTYNLEW